MKILRYSDSGFAKALAALNRRAAPDPSVERTVRDILATVRKNGDAAVIRYGEKFGGPALRKDQLRVAEEEITAAVKGLAPATRRAINAALKNVRAFARRGLRESWFMRNAQGAIVGERFDPFARVGIYVPGGTAPLVSTAVMTCGIAAAAGVPSIVAVTPPDKDGAILPELLAALALAGATEIHRIGGAQAVAALALGTETIPAVQKIFGPGNAYVVEAKRQLFGTVGVDLLPGPSEVLVIADASANPKWVAADLLAQAEHGHGSTALLLTNSDRLLQAVREAIETFLQTSGRAAILKKSLRHCLLVRTRDLKQAVAIANAFAPEHTAIATRDPGSVAGALTTSGAIFLGGISPVAAGDFLAGPSHTLPTGGAAKAFSGLTADQFQRRTSIIRYDRGSLQKSRAHLERFAAVEGLDAHGRSIAIRLD